MKILFISPHPDDVEFACGNTQIQLVKNKHEVYLVCMTADEYGTSQDNFKGERISKIRRNEQKRASRITKIHQLNWMGFIDGHVKITKENMKYIEDFIKKINPDVIFAPDPFQPVDFHPDHLKTGFMIISILKKWKNPPLTLLFYTLSPNFHIACKSRKLAKKAFSKHKSQFFDSKHIILFNSIFQLIHGFRMRNTWFAEAYRIIDFKKKFKKKSLKDRIKYTLFYLIMKIALPRPNLYKPIPEKLNLKEFRNLN